MKIKPKKSLAVSFPAYLSKSWTEAPNVNFFHLRQNKTYDPPHSYPSFAYMYTPIQYNRQLYDPSLTTTSFLFIIIYMYHYQQHLSMVMNMMIFSPELKWKECSRTILSRRSLWRTMLITLLKLKCVRKSEELEVKGRKRSGWKKIQRHWLRTIV